MSAPSCPGCGADLRSFEPHSRYCTAREHDEPTMKATPQDVAGMNSEAERQATAFAYEACSTFTISQHKNAYRRKTGADSACVMCGKPQSQHWLRQLLTAREASR